MPQAPPSQQIKPTQVAKLGESPADARRRMASGATVEQPVGQEVEGPLTPEQMAAIREAEEGFSGGAGGTVEDAVETTEPPTPSKAMETIRQLGQEKLQLQTELDAAYGKLGRYEAKFGEID